MPLSSVSAFAPQALRRDAGFDGSASRKAISPPKREARRRPAQRGLALILVLTVIMALAVIATPFVLSMLMHEKTAIADRARRQAGYGAEGVRNFAVSQLYRGAEHYERLDSEQGKQGASPYRDDPSEFVIDIRDARLKDLDIRNPQGSIWGVTAHDEQGKINVASAPDRICVNVRTNLSQRVLDLKDIFTVYSGRPARWVRPQKIREIGAIGNPLDPTGTKIAGARVDSVVQMCMGVKLRVLKPGLPPFESKVTRNGLHIIGVHAVETDPPIPNRYLHGILEIEMRHPVNINTARRETLHALFEGLAISIPTAGGAGWKTYTLGSDDAKTAADGLYHKNIESWNRFFDEALSLDLNDFAKAAVIINAVDPGNMLLHDKVEGRGSMGFCFTSNETVTIESIAAVNSEAGTPRGGAGFREVVDLGNPGILTRSWENQFDFDRMMGPPRLLVAVNGKIPLLPADVQNHLTLAGVLGAGYAGYPYGARMETFPKDLAKYEASDMTPKSQQGKLPNYISMRTERDYRGQGGIFRFIDHFDAEPEGHPIDGSAHPVPHPKAFAPQPLRADTTAGGTEFWIKFDGPPVANSVIKLFDIRESDAANRVSIELITNEIVYRISDSTEGTTLRTLDKGWSEIRAPFKVEKDTWYHIAAYWKGTKYGQMILMVDGFVPTKAKWRHVDDTEQTMSTELTSVMPMPDPAAPITTVPLKDSAFLQKPADWPREIAYTVPLQVGDEVIEYDPTRGEGRRGSRVADIVYGSKFQEHPQDAKVTVFGYTSPFRSMSVTILYQPPYFDPPGELTMRFGPLVQTTGKISLRFGIPEATTVVAEDTDPDGNMVLLPTTNRIKYIISDTVPADNMEWPDQGYIKIDDEAVFYGNITREGAKAGYFEQCIRGAEMSQAAVHQNGAGIELWSIAVDTFDSRIQTPTIIQVKEEWFGPVTAPQTAPPAPTQFWVGCLVNGRAVSMNRGWAWLTEPVRHELDEPIIPLYAAREVDTQVLRTNLARFDPVTVVNADFQKEPHVVCRAITIEELNQIKFMQNPMGPEPPPPPRNIQDQGVQLASMFSQTRNYYPVDDNFNRIVKWPSGELLDQNWLAKQNPNVAYGPAKAKIDELKNVASLKGAFLLNRVAPPEVPQLMVTNPQLMDPNMKSGIIVAGEEIIGFAQYDGQYEFRRCKRGWLNSTAQVHNQGDPVFFVSFLPVAAIRDQQVAPESRTVPLSQLLVGQGYTKGYVYVDGEVIGFEDIGINGNELDSLARFDGTGLFRGMFGTTSAGHSTHSMVFGLPFRYWDGYKQGQFDNRMPYFQVGHTTRDARWKEARYTIETGQNDPNLLPHSYLRIDGLGDQTLPRLDEHNAVWHFFKQGQNPLDDYTSSRMENGQVEVRFFLEYKPGSFWPNHSWKRTMKIHDLKIDYDRDTRVLFHEDK